MKELLQCHTYYHILQHTSSKGELFHDEADYIRFIQIFNEYLIPVADLYGYCLVQQQIQLLIKIKEELPVFQYFRSEGRFPEASERIDSLKQLSGAAGLNEINILSLHLNRQITLCFNAFARFVQEKYCHRRPLYDGMYTYHKQQHEQQLKQCLVSMHSLPVTMQLVNHCSQWKFSSYNALNSDKPTKIKRDEILGWFSDKQDFETTHRQGINHETLAGTTRQMIEQPHTTIS